MPNSLQPADGDGLRFPQADGKHTNVWAFGRSKVEATFTLTTVKGSSPFYILREGYKRGEVVTLVTQISLKVGGRSLDVFESAWSGLFDVNTVDVTQKKDGTYRMTFHGADGGSGYSVSLDFNRVFIWRQALYTFSDEPDETIYYHRPRVLP